MFFKISRFSVRINTPIHYFTSVLRTTIAIWERLIRRYCIVKNFKNSLLLSRNLFMDTFFRFVSPYVLGNPARPDQGFTSSDCSTAIDRREPTLRSHMLLSGNRKANQEPQKVFPPSSPRCSGSVRKIFWLKSPFNASR